MQLDGGRRRGFFLTLEGPEGSGKSTQAHRLAGRLTAAGYHCTVTREPGGTLLGEEVRKIILHELSPVPAADALLFNAARAQLVAEVIEPALARGDVVICDRFADSTLAYQGYGAGQSIEALRALAGYAAGDLVPDLTILIDLPVEEGLRRKRDRRRDQPLRVDTGPRLPSPRPRRLPGACGGRTGSFRGPRWPSKPRADGSRCRRCAPAQARQQAGVASGQR